MPIPFWDEMALLGVPLMTLSANKSYAPSKARLFEMLPKAGSHLRGGSPRERAAVQAFLLALKTHYPSTWSDFSRRSASIARLFRRVPRKLDGKIVKLRRIALAAMAAYL